MILVLSEKERKARKKERESSPEYKAKNKVRMARPEYRKERNIQFTIESFTILF